MGFDLGFLGEDPYATFSPLLQDPFEGLRAGVSGGSEGGKQSGPSNVGTGGKTSRAEMEVQMDDPDGSLFSAGVGDNGEGTHAGASTFGLFNSRGDEDDALNDSAAGKEGPMDYEAAFAALGEDPYALWPESGSDISEVQVVPDFGAPDFELGKVWTQERSPGNVFDTSSDDTQRRDGNLDEEGMMAAKRRADYDQEEHDAELRQAFAYDEEAPARGLGLPAELLGGAELAKDFDTNAYRKAAINRYKLKKQRRQFMKTIRYQCRKSHAESRPRYKGRFVKQQPGETPEEALERAKREDAEAMAAAKAAKAAKAAAVT